MKFTYIGTTKSGQSVKETVEAADRFAVYDIARQKGATVTNVSRADGWSVRNFFNMDRINAFLSRVSVDQLVLMTRNLSGMLTAGLPLSRALSVIERQTRNPRLKLVMADVRERIQKGDQFNQALAAHPRIFDHLYIAMVRAGEESGGLSEALKLLSVQMERSSSLRKRIKSAMIYPSIVLVIMSGIGIVMMIYVMPSITGTFKGMGVDLPATTKALITASDFMVANTVVFFLGLFAVIFGFIFLLRTRVGKLGWHWTILHLPIIGTMVKEVNAARTARTLSSLLTSGVDVMRSLEITTDVVQNVYYKPVLTEARKAVERGEALSGVFMKNEKLYPVFVGEMMMVGEETGSVGDMLKELAIFYENEVERKTKDLSTIIEPVLMVVIGATVGFFALAMIAPIYS
ncbi:MAG: type II secretion system F family protein, partial [Candidatus Paceibacterota bacterium]